MGAPDQAALRALAAGALTLATLVLAPVAGAATPPPTLAGEFLSGSPVNVTASCNPDGISTMSWTSAGTASGPYDGSFTESGAATLGRAESGLFVNGIPLAGAISIDVTFTIVSPAGTVTGQKHLSGPTGNNGCRDMDHFASPADLIITGTFRRLSAPMMYEATIVSGGLPYTDMGSASIQLEQFLGTPITEVDIVQESFISGQTEVTPVRLSATVRQPINADGSSVFKAGRGVVPVKFSLSSGGVGTCDLPAATLAVTRTSGADPGPVNESTFLMPADTGTSFRVTDCQYIYNLSAKSLPAGDYTTEIRIDGTTVGTASFVLR